MNLVRRQFLMGAGSALSFAAVHRPSFLFAALPRCMSRKTFGNWTVVAARHTSVECVNGRVTFSQGSKCQTISIGFVDWVEATGKVKVQFNARLVLCISLVEPVLNGAALNREARCELYRLQNGGTDVAVIGELAMFRKNAVNIYAHKLFERDWRGIPNADQVTLALSFRRTEQDALTGFGRIEFSCSGLREAFDAAPIEAKRVAALAADRKCEWGME
jgi:hypothetical protein